MARKLNTLILISCLFVGIFSSCKKEIALDLPAVAPEIVVDGWIENGNFPYVILTRTSQYFSNIDSSTLRTLVLTAAKVTVSDGVNSEILTLMPNNDYFPPYIYRGIKLKGEVNKTYYLTVEYAGETVTAQTIIPEPVKLDTLWFELNQGSDSLGVLKGWFMDKVSEKNYYKTFTQINNNTRFVPTLFSNFNDKYFNGNKFEFMLNRGQDTYLHPVTDIYFKLGDTITLKMCSLDKETYGFWLSYEDEVMNAANPFASSHKKVLSNIQGGLGIWGGYGASNYLIIAKL